MADGLLMLLLEKEEGTRLTVYDDADGAPIGPGSKLIGHPTIGNGRALDKRGISPAECLAMLERDADEAWAGATKRFQPAWGQMNAWRQRALASMEFALGDEGLGEFRRMIAAAIAGDWTTAAEETLKSRAALEEPARYHRLAEMLRTGTGPATI